LTRPRLVIDGTLFADLITELAARGQGRREAGAFLLADRAHRSERMPTPVIAVAYYDDLDPHCLNGAITFSAAGYTALNALCRRESLRVVGDIHTHPYRYVRQSHIDARHPMVAVDGHIALIAPHYAVGVTDVAQLGAHIRDRGHWMSFYGKQAAATVVIKPPRPGPQLAVPWWRPLLSRLHRHLRRIEEDQ
jgi:proteasome lid subunit RPN8/RPN11